MNASPTAALKPILTTQSSAAPRATGSPRLAYSRAATGGVKAAGDPTPLACTVAKNALEAALGGEGLAQLSRWLAPAVHASLVRQHAIARRGRYRQQGAIHIVRIRLQRTESGVVEAAVVAREGMRGRAIALRLEDHRGRWLITALEIG